MLGIEIFFDYKLELDNEWPIESFDNDWIDYMDPILFGEEIMMIEKSQRETSPNSLPLPHVL